MNKGLDSPIWDLAFRPFFLGGALFALVALGIWLRFLFGGGVPSGALDPIIWHAHEMVFGFTGAIVAGFVLTAAQNWTGIRGVHGRKLQALFLWWVLGRALFMLATYPSPLVSVVDLGFFPALAYCLYPYLKDPELKVERVFFLFFGLFFIANLFVHLDALGVAPGMGKRGVLLGLHTALVVIVFMGGRVIPFFTESSIARAQPRVRVWVETASHGSAWIFLTTQFFFQTSIWSAVAAFVAGVVHLIRLLGWQVPRVRRVPILWVLHLGYLWIVVGFFLSVLASFGLILSSAAVHAFTVGGLSVVIYGMCARVSLGHTGRPLIPSRWVVLGFYTLNAAALVRVVGPIVAPGFSRWTFALSGGLWFVSFGLFLLVYFMILISPRAKPVGIPVGS